MVSNEELFRAGNIETLYKRNKLFIFYLANKFSNTELEEDDFIGCGDMAFTKAIINYNPDKSKWISFFSRIMINEILQEIRIRNRQIKTISLEAHVTSDADKDNKIKVEGVIVSSADTMNEAINLIYIEEILELFRKLPERKREILELHLKGQKQREIGEKLNISKSYVGKVVNGTLCKLRAAYQKEI